MAACYSPFFTSGFLNLSQTNLATTPFDAAGFESCGQRRGSLPTNSLSPTASCRSPMLSDIDEASAYYFTLQPSRSDKEYRSYLSLDLAESSSLRSVSTSRYVDSFPPSKRDSSIGINQTAPSTPREVLRPRPSRESLRLRAMPSPKPAPVSLLPSVPSYSAGPSSSVSQTSDSAVLPSTPSMTLPTPYDASSRKRTLSLETTPTPSVRATRHADALAQLEGRARVTFMCFNDEDEDDLETEDVVLPSSPIEYYARASFLSLSPTTTKSSVSSRSRRGAFDSLMSSFIDLGHDREDEKSDKWNWRSFIEIGLL